MAYQPFSAERSQNKVKLSSKALKETLSIFQYVKPYKWIFALGLLFIVLSTMSTMAFPMLLKELIDSASQQHSIPFFQTPGQIALAMIALLGLQTIISFMRIYLFTYVGEHALADLRNALYAKLIRLPLSYFNEHRVGELNSRINADVVQIQDTVTVLLAEILRGLITLIVGGVLILFISAKLTAVMLSVVPVMAVFAVLFGRKIKGYSRAVNDQLAVSNTTIQETLTAIQSVKAFTNERFEINRYKKQLNQLVQLAMKGGKSRGLFVSVLLFAMFGTIVLVVWYGTQLMQTGALQFGDLTAFVIYTAFVGGTMAGFADLYSQLQKTVGATQRVRAIFEETEEAGLLMESVNISHQEELSLKTNLCLHNVTFAYPSRPDIKVLSKFNLKIHAGERLAIVGKSGAGKSTLMSLLMRFYDVTSGEIVLDGRSIKDVSLTSLRQMFAIVPQDIVLFGGTIRENIVYGRPDASEADVINAAELAYADGFIRQFPEGYETLVGERGIQLSGGQRQRIAIARAVLKDPKILLLDEATSHLDSNSEKEVQAALDNVMKGRTSIIIAHRLSTIQNADRIVVMADGAVQASGTHQELLADKDGLYAQLVQASEQSHLIS